MNDQQHHLLIVDDEEKLRDLLKKYLTEEGYRVGAVESAGAMDSYLSDHGVDLFILDLMLPGEDGLSIARRLRSQGNKPIIMLSARGEEIDRIVGLEVGADDYLAKPFNPRELLARIRSVLRRSEANSQPPAPPKQRTLAFGPFKLNADRHQLTREEQDIPLSNSEFTLLKVFLEHPERVLSRDRLLEITKGYERSPLDRSIDVCVNRLRQKIESNPSEPKYLRTIWGTGYLFSPDG